MVLSQRFGNLAIIGALIAALLFVLPVPAQDAPPKESEPGAKPPEPKTVAEVLKDSDRIDGLFTLYRDRKTGALRMALTADELEKTYFYFTYTENGVPAAGLLPRRLRHGPRRRVPRQPLLRPHRVHRREHELLL